MGSCDFWVEVRGKDANDAFWKAVEQAKYEYGHGGYSGTIAEKDSFVMIEKPDGKFTGSVLQDMILNDERVQDK